MMNNITPTQNQKSIIDDQSNVVVSAKPGSGKTFTIVEKIKCICDDLNNYQGVIAISFTRKASHELEQRCKRRCSDTKKTFFGTIDKFYITEIISPFSKHLTRQNVELQVFERVSDYHEYSNLENLKSTNDHEYVDLLIKSLAEGYIFLDICGETAMFIINHVPECLKYIKARYSHIFIDEYQDCGNIQHTVFIKLFEAGLCGIAVGDMDQAIYAFSGRYSRYLAFLMDDERFNRHELQINHRCHKSISDYSLKLFNVDADEICDDRRVYLINVIGSDVELMAAIDNFLEPIKEKYGVEKNNNIAILCRSKVSANRAGEFLEEDNKVFLDTELDRKNTYWARLFNDLLQSYFNEDVYYIDFTNKYIDKEIDEKNYLIVLELVFKIFHLLPSALIDNIAVFVDISRILYKEFENPETVEILRRVLQNEDELKQYCPASENEVCIMTLHKSKGLEFDIVFHMDMYRWIVPPERDDTTKEDVIQAMNLHYVGITRAKEVCYIMQGSQRYRQHQNDYIRAEKSPFLSNYNITEYRKEYDW